MQKSIQRMLVVIAILLSAIVLGQFTQRVNGQSPAVAPPMTDTQSPDGRYQRIISGGVESVFDTRTGQIWWHPAVMPGRVNQDMTWNLEPPLPSPKP